MLAGGGHRRRHAVLATFSSRDFILGLVQWKVPYEPAFMVFIALRFLPVFRDELVKVVTAVQLREADLEKVPWRQKIAMSMIFGGFCNYKVFFTSYGV